MKTISFTKVVATGNDFLILDTRSEMAPVSTQDRQKLASEVCHRIWGVGADGMVILEALGSDHFRWDFYNSDGSHAEMCGNAARGVVAYLGLAQIRLETASGPVTGRHHDDNEIEISMPQLRSTDWDQSIHWNGSVIRYDFINSGVPHAVIELEKGKAIPQHSELAQFLRNHENFQPNGTNVTFFAWEKSDSIFAQSFERGVEGFTLACGTGAVAVAAAAFHQKPQLQTVEVLMPGGRLEVAQAKHPLLRGAARVIAKVSWFR